MKKVLTIAACLAIALAFAGKAYSADTTTTAKETVKSTATTTTNTTAPTVVKDKVTVKETAKGTVVKEKETLTTSTGDTVKVKAKETTTATTTEVKGKLTDKPTVAETAKTGMTQEKATFKSFDANANIVTVIKDKKEYKMQVLNPAHWQNSSKFVGKTIKYTATDGANVPGSKVVGDKLTTKYISNPELAE